MEMGAWSNCYEGSLEIPSKKGKYIISGINNFYFGLRLSFLPHPRKVWVTSGNGEGSPITNFQMLNRLANPIQDPKE